jgi:uncharacterized protein YjbI with pentapeptide repeats
MSSSGPEETERSNTPLTRADIELLCSKVESPAGLDLSLQNLQNSNLAYMDLHGANLRGANLQGANLRGTNLSDANLQEADLSEADLDGADLSGASLGGDSVTNVNLYRANLSHATLRNLDLRGFDLSELTMQNADLNGSDLRDAILRGTDLRGADLSTALLHGPELRGARLYGNDFLGVRLRSRPQGSTREKIHASGAAMLTQERASIPQGREMEQTKGILSDREAYLLGKHTLLAGADPVKVRRLFPQGFTFASARQIFDGWLTQAGRDYSEKERQAMWIGFAHRVCELYYEDLS